MGTSPGLRLGLLSTEASFLRWPHSPKTSNLRTQMGPQGPGPLDAGRPLQSECLEQSVQRVPFTCSASPEWSRGLRAVRPTPQTAGQEKELLIPFSPRGWGTDVPQKSKKSPFCLWGSLLPFSFQNRPFARWWEGPPWPWAALPPAWLTCVELQLTRVLTGARGAADGRRCHRGQALDPQAQEEGLHAAPQVVQQGASCQLLAQI